MSLEERYTYTVVPRRPIRGLVKGKVLTRPVVLTLTKDEVVLCLKYGSVYRKFYPTSKSERVTLSSVDRLHRSEYMSEAQYNKMINVNVEFETEAAPDEDIDKGALSETNDNEETPNETVEENNDEEESYDEGVVGVINHVDGSTELVMENGFETAVINPDNTANEDSEIIETEEPVEVESLKKVEEEQLPTEYESETSTSEDESDSVEDSNVDDVHSQNNYSKNSRKRKKYAKRNNYTSDQTESNQ